jgi:hypothetical protein
VGFCRIIHLFRIIDTDFVSIWLDKQKTTTMTIDWVKYKHVQMVEKLEEDFSGELSDIHRVDLIVTRYWLCILLWKKALSSFLLTADADQSVLSIAFPTSLSRTLRQILASVSRQAVYVHGTGMMRKIFEISIALADIILLVPADGQKSMAGTLDDFNFLQEYLLSNPRFEPAERMMLQSKMQSLRSVNLTW